jgi:hypothetical protein
MSDSLKRIKFTAEIGSIKILNERVEQVHKHGIGVKDDVLHNPNCELSMGARALLRLNPKETDFPTSWSVARCRKMMNKPYKERLVIAGALIAAEIDRLIYLENQVKKEINDSKGDI